MKCAQLMNKEANILKDLSKLYEYNLGWGNSHFKNRKAIYEKG